MNEQSLRGLARQHYTGEIDREAYRRLRHELIDGIVAGAPIVAYQPPPPKKPPPAAPETQEPSTQSSKVPLFAGLAVAVIVIVVVAVMLLRGGEQATVSPPVATATPDAAAQLRGALQTFLAANDWRSENLEEFAQSWQQFSSEQRARVHGTLLFEHLDDAVYDQILEEQALAEFDEGSAALQQQRHLLSFAQSMGLSGQRFDEVATQLADQSAFALADDSASLDPMDVGADVVADADSSIAQERSGLSAPIDATLAEMQDMVDQEIVEGILVAADEADDTLPLAADLPEVATETLVAEPIQTLAEDVDVDADIVSAIDPDAGPEIVEAAAAPVAEVTPEPVAAPEPSPAEPVATVDEPAPEVAIQTPAVAEEPPPPEPVAVVATPPTPEPAPEPVVAKPQTPVAVAQTPTTAPIVAKPATEPATAKKRPKGCVSELANNRRPFCRDRLKDAGGGPTMVVLRAGEYDMGGSKSEEQPQRHVKIAYNFAMSVNEVTVAEFSKFCEASGRACPAQPWQGSDFPVVNVSWNDAQAYGQWLAEQTGKPYRLPTEAEWEYSARAGTSTKYPFGDELLPTHARFSYASTPDSPLPKADRSINRNAFRLYHMVGNVREWVIDSWAAGYQGAPQDGSAREDSAVATRVVRGGSFKDGADALRSAAREQLAATAADDETGFRVVLDLKEQAPNSDASLSLDGPWLAVQNND